MEIIIAEAISTTPIYNDHGKKLYHVRELDKNSEKFKAFNKILDSFPIVCFLEINKYLANYLNNLDPLVIVTDWSDPTELIGLRLESRGKIIDYPNLCFLAFYTNWDNIEASGIEDIFAHELSHMWLSNMGFDFELSSSNKFHTCTAITDRYLAFSEGFAEHLEIVTKEMRTHNTQEIELWDHAFDVDAWLCIRDSQLRVHAVKNNRFIYQTAIPYEEDFDTYEHLHMAHITSSAFTPEKLKNGLQMMSCEGVIASFFYQLYKKEIFKNSTISQQIYDGFGIEFSRISPIINLYIKILYVISRIDLKKETLMTDFVKAYGECFPEEREEVINVFTKVTHFSTVDYRAKELFGHMYRVGRRGNIEELKRELNNLNIIKNNLNASILNGEIELDAAIYSSIWIEGDKEITPIPWEVDKKEKYYFDINAATEVDFYSFNNLSFEQCCKLVSIRESIKGFLNIEEFNNKISEVKIMTD